MAEENGNIDAGQRPPGGEIEEKFDQKMNRARDAAYHMASLAWLGAAAESQMDDPKGVAEYFIKAFDSAFDQKNLSEGAYELFFRLANETWKQIADCINEIGRFKAAAERAGAPETGPEQQAQPSCTFTLDQADAINAQLGEALALAEVLAGHDGDHLENLQTFGLMLHERLQEAHRLFNRKEAA